MKILMVSSLWPPTVVGGAELHAGRLADELEAAGHQVGVVTLGVGGAKVVASSPPWPYALQDYADQPAWKRVAFHARDQYDPVTNRVVRRAIASFGADVVHSHSVPGLSISALTAPGQAGVAHVHTLHDYWLLCQRSTMVDSDDRACEPRCGSCRAISAVRTKLLDRHPPELVLAVSEAVADAHRQAGALADRIRVVRNPVEVPVAVPTRRPPGRPVVFGYIGQLLPLKGVRTLLSAMALLAPGSAHLLVAGRGPVEDEVDRALGVTALGWVQDEAKERFFADIDCLVVPSEWKDPAPLVLNEARSRRIPVIGASIGGIPELVAPECRPLLFQSGNATALAARMQAYGDSPGSFAVDSPAIVYGWPEHLELVLRAYEDARAARQAAR